jgi:hypothetical protein
MREKEWRVAGAHVRDRRRERRDAWIPEATHSPGAVTYERQPGALRAVTDFIEAAMLTAPLRRSYIACAVLAPLVIAALSASAQNVVVIRSNGGAIIGPTANTVVQQTLPISDDVVRALIERYEPSVLTDDAEANVVTIVLDNANNYVKSTARPARVLHADAEHITALSGDSVAEIRIRRPVDGEPQVIATGPVSVMSIRRTDGPGEHNGLLGTGVDAELVDAVSTKRYAPGSLTKSQLIVTVLRLK